MITTFIKTLSKGTLVAVSSIVFLLGANIATLLSSSFHDALYGAIPKSWAADSIKSKYDAEIKTHKQTKLNLTNTEQELSDTKTRLESEISLNKKNRAALKEVDIKSSKSRAKYTEISSKIAQRLGRNTSVNILSVPAESVPIYGVGVIAAVTAMDLNDACQTMKDLNNLMIEIGLEKNNADETIICGRRLPSSKEVKSQIKENINHVAAWTEAYKDNALRKIKADKDRGEAHYQDFQYKFGGFIHFLKEKISNYWSRVIQSVSDLMFKFLS